MPIPGFGPVRSDARAVPPCGRRRPPELLGELPHGRAGGDGERHASDRSRRGRGARDRHRRGVGMAVPAGRCGRARRSGRNRPLRRGSRTGGRGAGPRVGGGKRHGRTDGRPDPQAIRGSVRGCGVMKVALVNPPRFDGVSVVREERCEVAERYSVLEPYSLLQLAAMIREAGHSVNLFDANGLDANYSQVESWLGRTDYDALIFRFTPTTYDHDLDLARASKRIHPGARTIGMCWTLRTVPLDVMNDAPGLDIYLRHEYETVGPMLIEALEGGARLDSVPGLAFRDDGHVRLTPDAPPIKNYDAIPVPAYDLLPSLSPYFVSAPACKPFTIMYASKGC